MRRGLTACLGQRPNLEIVGEAADGQEALRKAKELVPDVLLTDLDMPHLTGVAVAEALHKVLPQIKVLVLSTHNNTELILRCAQVGASGYVLKQAAPDEFFRAIEMVNAGQSFFSPDVTQAALKQFVRGNGHRPEPSDLTHREQEVLVHIAEGFCNKEIALRLNIGTRTVETHRERLMRKLSIHTIAGLTRFAVAKGMVHLSEPVMA